MLACGATAGFEKQEGREHLAVFVQVFNPEELSGNVLSPEIGWFIGKGDKAGSFVKDAIGDGKDLRARQAALYLFCKVWPDKSGERIEKAMKAREPEIRTFAERLRGHLEQEKRLMCAQIVDDPHLLEECAILEGKSYKYFLRMAAAVTEQQLEDKKDEQTTVEQLKTQPNLYRGREISRHGVVLEVDLAELPAEYGLPGWTVLPALFVSQTRELFELRIVCAPGRGEKLRDKLQSGIDEGKNPVMRMSGYFMKCHAKNSSKKGDGPWREPLLVAPEPNFPKLGWVKNVREDLEQSGYDKYLPSIPIKAPRAEERLVVELLPGPVSVSKIRVNGSEAPLGDVKFVSDAMEQLKKRLPTDQAASPSAIVIKTVGAPNAAVRKALETLQGAGCVRAYFYDESAVMIERGRRPGNPK